MATVETVRYVDDLDGSEAVGTVQFGLDGKDYEIDLNADHAQALRENLAEYIEHGRRVKGHGKPDKPGKSNGGRTTTDRAETQRIREWAREKGIEINERGRIPKRVVEQYQAA